MNDERLVQLLGALRHERMDRIADDEIRARLETAWTARAERRSFGFRVRRLVPALATLALLAGLAVATMNASGDSALYGVRVAIEDAAVALRPSPEDRNEYLLALLDARQAEAARLESTGSALAASRVRQIEQDTLRRLQASLPEAPDEDAPVVAASPSPTPTPLPSLTSTPTVTPTVQPTPPPARTPAPTPRPTATLAPPVKTTPTPIGTAMPVTVTGTIKNPDGSLASGVCIGYAPGACVNDPSAQTGGTYRLTISARANQSITLYFTRTTNGILYKASTTKTITGTSVTMSTVTLAKQ